MTSNLQVPLPEPSGEIILYRTEDGTTRIELRLVGDTVWLPQRSMADLFQVTVPTVNEHVANLYGEGELVGEATIRKFRIVQIEGKRHVSRDGDHYNLDVIISLGYRVHSHRGTQFRIWATQRLREFLIKGFAMDDERLKRAAHCQTAAEIVYRRADASQPNMGLTSWAGDRPRKTDVEIAKNYLNAQEIEILNRIVTAYLELAELQSLNRRPMYMADWIAKLDSFLQMSDRDVLTHAGKISHDASVEKAEAEFEKFRQARAALPQAVDLHFEQSLEELTQIEQEQKPLLRRPPKTRPKPKKRKPGSEEGT